MAVHICLASLTAGVERGSRPLITPFLPILSLYTQAKACLTKKYGL